MSSQPLLSLAVPVYNGSKFLPGCLDSLEAGVKALPEADRSALELVLCDNHSTDDSLEQLRARHFGCATQIIQPPAHFENRTLNWDHALRATHGEWMLMLHADDLLAPGGFNEMFQAIRRKAAARAALIGGQHRVFTATTPPGRPLPRWPLPSLVSGEKLRAKILPHLCVFPPFLIMRRSVYDTVGGLDPQYQLVQDWDLWYRMLAHGGNLYHPGIFCHWLSHPYSESMGNLFSREMMLFVSRLSDTPTDALKFQLAKIRTHNATIRLSELVAETDAEPKVASLEPITPESAAEVLRSFNRQVGIDLQLLRLTGLPGAL
jgi:glycosyltransferase involved in cell wall biosynthesis